MLSHEQELDILDKKYKAFTKESHSTPLTNEICTMLSLIEGYKLQATILLIKASKLEKMVNL